MREQGEWLDELKGCYQDVHGFMGSWADFLAQPEIGLTVSEADTLIGVHRAVQKYGDRLMLVNERTLRYMVKKNVLSEDIIDDAIHLSHKDFREQYYEKKTGSEKRTYTYMVMKRSVETGNLEKVHGIESEEILSVLGAKINE